VRHLAVPIGILALACFPHAVGASLIDNSERPMRDPDYRGSLRSDSRAEVRIKVAADSKRVLFQARGVEMYPEEGDASRLRPNGTFARQEEQPRSFIVHRLFDPPSAGENRFGLARTDPADPTQVLRKQSYRELKQLAEPSGTHQRIRCQTA